MPFAFFPARLLAAAHSAKLHRAQRQRGFTLVETLIVIVIVAGILGIAFVAANRVNERTTVNEFVSTMHMMATETRSAFRSQANFSGATTNNLIGMGVVPAAMVDTGTIRGPWGVITVAPSAAGGSANSAAHFTINGVPAASCLNFVNAVESAFARVDVAATIVKHLPATPLNMASVATGCNAATGGVRIVHLHVTR